MSYDKTDGQDSSSQRAISKFDCICHTSYTCLENLSNEILYEILEYLDAYDILKSFSNLNNRLQNLIISSSILLRIELDSESKSLLEYRCQHVIIPNSHRILSLHLPDFSTDQLLIDTFFNHCIIDPTFHRLESIVLKGIKTEKLLTTLFYLKSLPRLFSLNIFIKNNDYYDLGNIYPLIFSLPTLKYNRLSISTHKVQINIPHVINKKFSTIEYMVIAHCCTLNQLNSIVHYTPQLRRLSCNQVIESNENYKNELSMKLPHLKSTYFGEFSASFDEFEVFIKEISFQLQILNIRMFWNKACLDGNRWKRLIKEYMPQLEKFYFHFNHVITDSKTTNLIDSIDEFIDQFNSPFWFERKWFREIKIDYDEMVFLIHPYRNEWISLHKHMNTDTNFEQNSIEDNYISNREKIKHHIIQLTIGNNEFTELNWRFIKKLKTAFKAIQFTHLNIENNSMCIHMLLDILSSLPNIESLKLSFLLMFSTESSSIENTENYLSVLATNKITKVKLSQLTEEEEEEQEVEEEQEEDQEQEEEQEREQEEQEREQEEQERELEQEIEFFINLCPHIEYLEVECMSDTDVPLLMKFIMNQRIRIPNLCYLCFITPMADENMQSYFELFTKCLSSPMSFPDHNQDECIKCDTFDQHERHLLDEQLDWLTVDHDDLKEDILERIARPRFHPSMAIIDTWEEQAIARIRYTAILARQTLFNALDKHILEISKTLNELTPKLCEARWHTKPFDKNDIQEWNNILRELKKTPIFPATIYNINYIPELTIDLRTQYQTPQYETESYGVVSFIYDSSHSTTISNEDQDEPIYENIPNSPSLDNETIKNDTVTLNTVQIITPENALVNEKQQNNRLNREFSFDVIIR
ncbi:unnamed protein product [Adineta steineri]|uniref:F-box domain-containing protein n=2 Tax=Adineta steineri TaxID=433720 RepID=A0A819GJT2_9BILA|nr:unnamed protein product [Adineta steineri]